MKKLCLFFLLAGIAIAPASAQKHFGSVEIKQAAASTPDEVPGVVKQAFQQKFSTITGETWHKMASGHWYADFREDSSASKAEFTPEGQWVATRTALNNSELPATLTNAIQQKYPGASITQVVHIDRSDVAPYYQISLQINGTEKDILANNDGTITNL